MKYHAEEYSKGEFYLDGPAGEDPPGGPMGPFKSKGEAKAACLKKGMQFENSLTPFTNGRMKAENEISKMMNVASTYKYGPKKGQRISWSKKNEDQCAGCGCLPGEGKTPGCQDPDGCGR